MESKQIDSLEQYRELTVGRKMYNNGFSREETKKYIETGRLYYVTHKSAKVFLYDEKRYMQIVFPVENPVDDLKELVSDASLLPLVCYAITDGKPQGYDFEKLVKALGFRQEMEICEFLLADISQRVVLPRKDDIQDVIKQPFQYTQILDLWRENLPYTEIPYLTVDDVKAWESKKQLLYLEDAENNIKAVCCMDGFLGNCTIHHLVVDEKWRGCGYAVELLNECLERSAATGMRRARGWIESRNLASQRSVLRFGFHMTEIKSYQYIYNGGE